MIKKGKNMFYDTDKEYHLLGIIVDEEFELPYQLENLIENELLWNDEYGTCEIVVEDPNLVRELNNLLMLVENKI